MVENSTIIERFKKICAQGRLAHAYLFSGPEGAGKLETALAIARMLNCEAPRDNDPCGVCASCRKIASGNHPDIFVLQAGVGEMIKIDDIRAVIQRSSLRAFEAKWKVFIIRNAERLNKESSNALLKTLEEPNRQTLIILTTAVAQACLETIKSRCQAVNFYPLSQASVMGSLMQELGVDEASAQTLAYFSQGNLTRAKGLFEEKFHIKKNRIIDEMVMKRHADQFIKKVLSDKQETQTVLYVILSLFRDLMLVKSGIGEPFLANRDRIKDVRELAGAFSFNEIETVIGRTLKALRLLKDNLNVKMSLSLIKEMAFK